MILKQLTKEKILQWISYDIAWREVNGKHMACYLSYIINKAHAGMYDIQNIDSILMELKIENRIKEFNLNNETYFTLI